LNYQFLIKNLIWNIFNRHYKGPDRDIVIFTTRRSGGTWLTNIIETQKNIKSVNEPLSQARAEDMKQKRFLPNPNYAKYLSLNEAEKKQVFDFFNLIFEEVS
jgi:hypothetical protein